MQEPGKRFFIKTSDPKLNIQLAQIGDYCYEVERQSTFITELLMLSGEMVAILSMQKKYRPVVDRWMYLAKSINQ